MRNLLEEMNQDQKEKLVAKCVKRLSKSYKYYYEYFENWKIYYKMYYSLKDAAAETDEPNMLVPVAYGIVEDAVARLVVPILQKLPIVVKAKVLKYADNAQKFYNACKDYYGMSDFRLDRISSEREFVITGNAWEIYEWKNDWLSGKAWSEVEQDEEVQYPITFLNKLVQTVKGVLPVKGPREQPKEYPECVGFHTRFPSVFDMFPEDGLKRFDRMNWVIEDLGNIAIEELERAKYIDPSTRENKPVYDLTELLKDNDGKKDKIRPAIMRFKQGEEISVTISGRDTNVENTSDTPAVHVLRVYNKDNSIYTIVQGKYLIHAVADVYHYPVMPIQLRTYVADKENLFGTGIIQPILELLYEVNDIHNMSFANWIRSINKMVVYDEAVIKHPDDFTPRAGGKIRARLLAGGDVNKAFGVVDHADVSGSMINMESQSMGKIERTISITDLTPGAQGTKAYHKTYGGLMEIQSNFARRFTIMMMCELAYLTKQMQIMYWMFQQFMFEDMPMGRFDEGVFKAETYRREDFDSGGQGFLFMQATDPSFGDSAVQRNQLMVLLDQAMKYEGFRMTSRDPSLMKMAVDKLMRMNLEAFGMQDTSTLMAMPNGVVDPNQEFEMMLQGVQPQVNPREPLTDHLLAHVSQRNDPKMLAAVGSGKMAPEVMAELDKHINDTMKMIQLFIEQVDQIAMAKKADESMAQGGPGMPRAMSDMSPQMNTPETLGAEKGVGLTGGKMGGQGKTV